MKRWATAGVKAVVPVLLVALWALLARRWATALFPAPQQVLAAGWDWITGATGAAQWYSGTWLRDVAASLGRIAAGFALGCAAAVVLGVWVGWSRWAEYLWDGTIQLLRPISVAAWLPVAIFVFGIGTPSAIFLIALAAFFPVYVNTVQAVRFAEKRFTWVAAMLGAGRVTLLLRVVLPMAQVGIFSGMRVAAGIAWAVVTIAEMLAVKSGVGYMLWDSYYNLRVDLVFAGMATLGALGYATDRLVLAVMRRTLHWAREIQLADDG